MELLAGSQQLRRLIQRQSHDAGITARYMRYPSRRPTLDAIGPGFAPSFAAGNISCNIRRGQRSKTHAGNRQCRATLRAALQSDGGQDLVLTARQQRQYAHSICCVSRFTQNRAIQRYRGVST